jgi:hypothetical protein
MRRGTAASNEHALVEAAGVERSHHAAARAASPLRPAHDRRAGARLRLAQDERQAEQRADRRRWAILYAGLGILMLALVLAIVVLARS